MELTLDPEVKKIIEDCVNSGEFTSAEQVVSTAIHRLREQDRSGDFAPGELNRLIAEADKSGPPISYEQVRARIQALRDATSTDDHNHFSSGGT